MRRLKTSLLAVVLAAPMILAGYTLSGAALQPSEPAASDGGAVGTPLMEPINPLGIGESLVLVVGGVYSSQEEAQSAAQATQSELQGLYAAPAEDFTSLATYAETAPARSVVACSGPAILTAMENVPELAQIAEHAFRDECPETGLASVVRDVQLSDVSADCEAEAACLRRASAVLDDTWPDESEWLTVSAFRTLEGAEAFMTYIREMTHVRPFAVRVLRHTGTSDIGLGQEPHPDGSGPLLAPLPDQASHQ